MGRLVAVGIVAFPVFTTLARSALGGRGPGYLPLLLALAADIFLVLQLHRFWKRRAGVLRRRQWRVLQGWNEKRRVVVAEECGGEIAPDMMVVKIDGVRAWASPSSRRRSASEVQTALRRLLKNDAREARPMPMSPYYRNLRERLGSDLLLIPAIAAVLRDEQGRVRAREYALDFGA